MEKIGCPSDGTLCWKDTWFYLSLGCWPTISSQRRQLNSLGHYPSLLTIGLTTSNSDDNCNENNRNTLKSLTGRFRFGRGQILKAQSFREILPSIFHVRLPLFEYRVVRRLTFIVCDNFMLLSLLPQPQMVSVLWDSPITRGSWQKWGQKRDCGWWEYQRTFRKWGNLIRI